MYIGAITLDNETLVCLGPFDSHEAAVSALQAYASRTWGGDYAGTMNEDTFRNSLAYDSYDLWVFNPTPVARTQVR